MRFLCLILCYILIPHFGQSGILLEKFKGGFTQARQKVHCGLHKVGENFFEHNHQTDPCQNNEGNGENVIDTGGHPPKNHRDGY